MVGAPCDLDAVGEALPGVLRAIHPRLQPPHVFPYPRVASSPAVGVAARIVLTLRRVFRNAEHAEHDLVHKLDTHVRQALATRVLDEVVTPVERPDALPAVLRAVQLHEEVPELLRSCNPGSTP